MSPPAPAITPELRSLLRGVKLGQLMATLPERLALARARELSHAEFLELILSDEVTRRESTSAARRARDAGLDPHMRLETFDATAAISYDHHVFDELFSLRFIDNAANALIMGPVGTGKTFIATALGHAAVRRRATVHFERADRLLKRLKAARLDNSHDTEMRKLLRTDLLILDDFCPAANGRRRHRRHLRDHRRTAPRGRDHHDLQPRTGGMAGPDGRRAARPVSDRPAPVRRLRARPGRRVLPAPATASRQQTRQPRPQDQVTAPFRGGRLIITIRQPPRPRRSSSLRSGRSTWTRRPADSNHAAIPGKDTPAKARP
jgi:IstB-like ATP binding protein